MKNSTTVPYKYGSPNVSLAGGLLFFLLAATLAYALFQGIPGAPLDGNQCSPQQCYAQHLLLLFATVAIAFFLFRNSRAKTYKGYVEINEAWILVPLAGTPTKLKRLQVSDIERVRFVKMSPVEHDLHDRIEIDGGQQRFVLPSEGFETTKDFLAIWTALKRVAPDHADIFGD